MWWIFGTDYIAGWERWWKRHGILQEKHEVSFQSSAGQRDKHVFKPLELFNVTFGRYSLFSLSIMHCFAYNDRGMYLSCTACGLQALALNDIYQPLSFTASLYFFKLPVFRKKKSGREVNETAAQIVQSWVTLNMGTKCFNQVLVRNNCIRLYPHDTVLIYAVYGPMSVCHKSVLDQNCWTIEVHFSIKAIIS